MRSEQSTASGRDRGLSGSTGSAHPKIVSVKMKKNVRSMSHERIEKTIASQTIQSPYGCSGRILYGPVCITTAYVFFVGFNINQKFDWS